MFVRCLAISGIILCASANAYGQVPPQPALPTVGRPPAVPGQTNPAGPGVTGLGAQQRPSGQPPGPPKTGEQPAQTPQMPSTPQEALRLAQQRYAAGYLGEAMQLVQAVLGAMPSDVEANLLAGEIYVASNNYDGARDFFVRVTQIEPSNYRANLGLGKIWIANRYMRQAESHLEKAENVAPESGRSEVKRLLAMVYAQQGKAQKAIDKAVEAVRADPTDLDSLRVLIQIRQSAAPVDPSQLEPLIGDADQLLLACTRNIARDPWSIEELARLDDSFQIKLASLQIYHNSFYQRDLKGEPTDQLLPGKGPDAAAVLVRSAETLRAHALVRLVRSEMDAILVLERAVAEGYDPRNAKSLERLLASYQQVQQLMNRLVARDMQLDHGVVERCSNVARRILALDPENAAAKQYLESVGLSATTQPAEAAPATGPEPGADQSGAGGK